MQSLLTTKLARPALRKAIVARSHLVERVQAGLAGPLTLLSAPAGFGKTTLLTDALRPYQDGVAWLTLDPDDAEPLRFVRYLVAALQRASSIDGEVLESLLGAQQPPPLEAILTQLINELASLPRDVVLVLDDYHVIDAQPIHAGMAFLLAHLPPRLHLVIATRDDPPLPLARLRARGEVTELRAADLRFTPVEAAEFLTEVMRLELSAADVQLVAERTEGWIAGLQLAALAMRDVDDIPEFIATLRGTHRYILDYLTDEVLERQPTAVQTFLLQTSILDRLCGPLCDAVLGYSQPAESRDLAGGQQAQAVAASVSPSQAPLERLERANLFLVPLDTERRWYRYHALFADLLRSRIVATMPDQVPELNRRASRWYAQQAAGGDTTQLAEAVRHALAAADHDLAADLIARQGGLLLGQGQLRTLRAWLEQLPGAVIAARPELLIAQGWIAALTGQWAALAEHLHAAERALDTFSDPYDSATQELIAYLRGNIATLEAYDARHRGDRAGAIAAAQAALHWLPADRTTTRTATHLILGISLLQADDLAGAHTHLQSAITLGQTSGNRHAALAAQDILGELLSSQGRLHAAAALYRQGIAANLTRDGQPLPIAGDLYVGLGHVLYMWNDLPAAAEHLSQGLALGEQVANWWTTQSAAIILAWLRQVQGDGAGAHALLQHAEMVALANDDFVEVNQLLAQQARVSLAQGNLAAVAGWVAQAGLRSDATPVYGEERLYRMLARALIVLGKPGEARALVQRMQEAATAAGRTGSLISLLVLHALALHAEGSLTDATHELDRALRLAAPEGYLRVFVDEGNTIAALLQQIRRRVNSNIQAYIDEILAVFDGAPVPVAAHPTAPRTAIPARAAPPAPTLDEALRPREIELLHLLAAGLSNREIAGRLVMTVGTVKWYLNHLYTKLHVRGRTQAIARARERGLLS